MAAAKIDLIGIEKWFGDSQVIKGVDLHIESGELIVFVGPSGCGKSTLLRIIAGLTDASRGQVLINGRDVTGELPAQRGLAMVFQSYALYPHMTVQENMGFALKSAGQPADKVAAKVQEVAQVLQLDELLARTPKELSGGQRQRVAIGRAIVRDPVAFLFDEPLSNLDAALRIEMRFEIARLHRILGAPMIYVTHDQVEAMTLADRIVVLREGRVEQVGSPRELYEKPATKFVAQFIGSPKMNIMPCTAQDGKLELDGKPTSIAAGPGSPVELGARPEHIALTSPGEGDCKGTVALAEYLGADLMVYADCGSLGMITIRCSGNEKHAVGDACGLRLDRENIHLLDSKQQVIEAS